MARRIGVAILLIMALAAGRAAALESSYIVSADYIYFNIDKKTLSCTGHVLLTYDDIRIYSDEMRVDVKFDVLEANGNVRVVSVAVPLAKAAAVVPAGPVEKDAVVQETESAKKEIDNSRTGDTLALHGEFLQYDMNYMQGMILQTSGKVQRYWFKGAELGQVAPIKNMRAGEYFDATSATPMTSMTARKVRISPANKYEAWKANLYVEGGKTIGLPYYTNDAGKIVPGKWRLHRINYSSNDNFSFGVGIRYNEKRNSQGTFSLDYRDKGSAHFVLGLDQQLHLGKSIGGSMSLSDIGASDSALNLNLNRYTTGLRSQSLGVRSTLAGSTSMNMNMNDTWKNTSIRAMVSSYFDSKVDAPGSLSATFNVTPPSKYLDRRKKLNAGMDTGISYYDYGSSDPSTDAYASFSLNRYSWAAGRHAQMSSGINYGINADDSGNLRNTVGGSVSYNLTLHRNTSMSMSYRTSQGVSNKGGGSHSQGVSTSVSYMKGAKWSTRLSSSFDLLTGRMSMISGTFDFTVNKKARFSTTAAYDTALNHFSTNIFHLNYRFYGSQMNVSWYKESNNFMVDFVSQFR